MNISKAVMLDTQPFKAQLTELIRARDFDAISYMEDVLGRIAEDFGYVSERHWLESRIRTATSQGRGCKRDAERLLTVQRILEADGIDPVTGEIADRTWMPEPDEEDEEPDTNHQ